MDDDDQEFDGHPVALEDGEFALVFRTDGATEVYLPGDDVTPEVEARVQYLQEFLEFALNSDECKVAFDRSQRTLLN